MVEQGRFCPSARKPEAETAAAGRRKGFLSVRAAAGRNPPFADKTKISVLGMIGIRITPTRFRLRLFGFLPLLKVVRKN